MAKRATPLLRLERQIDFDGPNGCWVWTSRLRWDGYGQITVDYRKVLAHRLSYMLLVGPIAPELVIDHLCRNRACVNPEHLEVVTAAENTRRGAPAQKTHCTNGHRFDVVNTYTKPNGQRDCRACIRERVRAYNARKAAA